MKTISATELGSSYSLIDRTRKGIILFICGITGTVFCFAILIVYSRYAEQTNQDRQFLEQQVNPSIDLLLELREKNRKRSERFSQTVIPLFLGANISWVIGGAVWMMDRKRTTQFPRLKLIGGLLVFATGAVCITWWLILYSNFAANR